MFARRALPRLQQPLVRQHGLRTFSTTELSNGVKMAYELYEPENGKPSQGAPIVFVHGLFGSKRNHRSMSKYALLNTPKVKLSVADSHAESSYAT
jgi:hypothetical protein